MTLCVYPGCSYQLVPKCQWEGLTRLERWQLRQNGRNEYGGRGLCKRCHDRAKRYNTLHDFPRLTVSREEVLAEWAHVDRDRTLPRKQQIQMVAPRMGMTPEALERALLRAQKESA